MGEVGGVRDSPPVRRCEGKQRRGKKLENSPTDFTSSGLTAWAALGLQNGYPARSSKEGLRNPTNLCKEAQIRMSDGAAHTDLSA